MSEASRITWLWAGWDGGQGIMAPGESHDIVPAGRNFTFYWISLGKAALHLKGKSYEVVADDIILLKPRQQTRWQCGPLEPAVMSSFGFDMLVIPDNWPPLDEWPTVRHMPRNDIVRPLFEYIMGHSTSPTGPGANNDTEVPLALQAAVEAAVAAFVCGPLERVITQLPDSYPQPVQRVMAWLMDFMNTEPDRRVTLEDMARTAGVSPKHLCRLFHQHLGYPPLEVVYLYRVTRSLIGLRAGKKIDSLAQELGFSDAAHYTRRFVSLFGKSPARMRKLIAKGYKPRMPKLPTM